MTSREARTVEIGERLVSINLIPDLHHTYNDEVIVYEVFEDENGFRTGTGMVFNKTTGDRHHADFTLFHIKRKINKQ